MTRSASTQEKTHKRRIPEKAAKSAMHFDLSAWRFSSFFSAVQQFFPHALRHKRAARCPNKVRDIFLWEIAENSLRRRAEVHRACEARAGRGLGKDALALIQGAKIRHEMLIGDGKAAFG